MNQNRIEEHCFCGRFQWDGERWTEQTEESPIWCTDGYCWICGYHLGPDGIARRTVVVPKDVVKTRLIHAVSAGSACCFGYPIPKEMLDAETVYLVIPVPQEGEGE